MMPVTSWKVAVTAYAATVLLLPHLATALNAVLIGDSILASSDTQGGLGAINKYLNEFSGQKLNNYAKIGSSLHDGRVKSIPQLYQDMRTQTAPAVPSTIVLNGGGNDVISVRDDCWAFNDKCQLQIDSAMEIAEDLMLRMHDDGVQHIIYLGFYYAFNMTQAVDYGTERVKRVCRDAAIDCFVADVRDLDVVVGPDGLHPGNYICVVHLFYPRRPTSLLFNLTNRLTSPDDAGYRHLADRIWETKQEYNIPF